MVAALALSVLVVLCSTLPVQAQNEGADNDTSDTPGEEQTTDTVDTPGSPRSTGKHMVAFGGDKLPSNYRERIVALGGEVETELSEIGVAVATGLTEQAAQSLRADQDVKLVVEDVELPWLDPLEEPTVEEASAEDASAEDTPASQGNPATAFFHPRQWHLRAINANKAWAAGELGSPKVRVAILDSGIDYSNPDLNGLVDLENERSKSFVPSEDALVSSTFPGRHPSTDLRWHGTHVAATVSSKAQLAAGVTSKVKLMAVKVLNKEGNGTTSAVLAGVTHAAKKEADVINMSLGSARLKGASPDFVHLINRAFNYANRQGSTIVVAAGNDARNLDEQVNGSDVYQAYCNSPHVVCVSATGPTSRGGINGPWTNVDAQALYSNYGSPITVAGPGGSANGPVYAVCSSTSLVVSGCRTGNAVLGSSGTSMATPHVSGLAALLVEKIGKGQPSKVAAQIRKSSYDLGDPDKDVKYGHGRIDVAKALDLP
jgi:subtilisin family serine protease